MSGLAVNKLSINHGAIAAVKELSFTVEKGQLAAVIGSNGAGKTTLLRALSGLIPATGGAASWKGQTLLGRKPEDLVRAGVVHVSEGKSVIPELNVKENLALGGIWRKDKKMLPLRPKKSLNSSHDFGNELLNLRILYPGVNVRCWLLEGL